MGSEGYNLHILFFPGFSHGHIFPLASMVKLFASRGVRSTILTTPANAPSIKHSISEANTSISELIHLRLIPFPSAAAGLPEGCENFSSVPESLRPKFFQSLSLFRNPFEEALRELLPDCVVTNMFMPWTYDVAAEIGVPRLVFHGTSFFSLCIFDYMVKLWPLESLPLGTESFALPGIPHQIEMLVSQIPDFHMGGTPFSQFFRHISEIDAKSYGVVVNSFSDLEPEYVEHYREIIGRKAWHVGPVALPCNKDDTDQKKASHACLKWLDEMPPCSVVYVCFGSLSSFTKAQLRELALGLAASGHRFVWVVGSGSAGDEWMPEGFEERIADRGLIIRDWAPQLLILNHAAVGGFMTHCGWNSIMEGITAGLPMVTWPLYAEQFYNERLVVQVLNIGVEIGTKLCTKEPEERVLVEAEAVVTAVRRVMGKEGEAEERRRRVMELRKKAREASEVGGSSYEDMGCLIKELVERKEAVVKKSKRMSVAGEKWEEVTPAAEDSVLLRKYCEI